VNREGRPQKADETAGILLADSEEATVTSEPVEHAIQSTFNLARSMLSLVGGDEGSDVGVLAPAAPTGPVGLARYLTQDVPSADSIMQLFAAAARRNLATTEILDLLLGQWLVSHHHVFPSPVLYSGFQGAVCTSVNEVLCHGVPSDGRLLCLGDLVSIDVSAFAGGRHGDACRTFLVGPGEDPLIAASEAATLAGIAAALPGARLSDVGAAITRNVAELNATIEADPKHPLSPGVAVQFEFLGHYVGDEIHIQPNVAPCSRDLIPAQVLHDFPDKELVPGDRLTIEPILRMKPSRSTWFGNGPHLSDCGTTIYGGVNVDAEDKWSMLATDGARSAQYEDTIVIQESGPPLNLTREM
jgi:methionyl aminopeptidase